MIWRLLEPHAPARSGAENMAIDHALLEGVKAEGRPVLRLYRWMPACLSFGRNQPARGLYDADRAAARGIDLVRRPTGGMAVHHDRELTYAVVLPVGMLGSPRETYRAISHALVAGLARCGVTAEVFEGGVAAGAGTRAVRAAGGPPPTSISARARGESIATRDGAAAAWLAPCFRTPSPGEIVAAGRKLVGSAQCREGRVLLQHGSILLEGDQAAALDLLHPDGAPRGAVDAPATLHALLGVVPPLETLTAALIAGFEAVLRARLVQEPLDRSESERAAALAAHYCSADWTWRR